jgi:hypothetical protein
MPEVRPRFAELPTSQFVSQGLRYLDFRHVDTRPFPTRLLDAKAGLQEVKDMNELVERLQDVDERLKVWFRAEMGMSKGWAFSSSSVLNLYHGLLGSP